MGAAPVAAQDAAVDDPAVLSLIRKARALRESAPSLAALAAYRAGAEGHIYFYLDREDGGAPIPIRVDQVAVDLYQNSVGQRRQVIQALRKRELFPLADFDYYIDRLTAVQNGFGNRIAIGEGRDVRNVPHPLGRDGEDTYRYQVADSIRLIFPGRATPIRVYEVAVRPRREDRPGMVGSVFIDVDSGALVRMTFGFTPASYLDPRTDRVTVRLEHRFWEAGLVLPHRQVVEVRRELPELDLPVGSVIRATLDVVDFELNPELAPDFFSTPVRPTRPPYNAADSTAFRDPLMGRMAEEGLSPVSAVDIEAEARRAARAQIASGLPRVRVYTDRVSSVLRANRAEGVHVGLGASYAPTEGVKLDVLPGYGTGNGAFTARVRGQWMVGEVTTATLAFHGRQLRDAGPFAGASGAVNTLSTLLRNHDYTDPWLATGVGASLERAVGGAASVRVGVVWEEMSAVRSPVGFGSPEPLRGVRPVDEGPWAALSAGVVRRWRGLGSWGAEASVNGTAGRWEGRGAAKLVAGIEGSVARNDLSRRATLRVDAGALWGEAPRQLHFLLGGRGTLPGHPYRAYGGRTFALTRGEASMSLPSGWLSARLVAGAGAVGATPSLLGDTWQVGGTGGLLGYAGLGLGALHDVIRVDGAWGIPGGAFELWFSVDPMLRRFF